VQPDLLLRERLGSRRKPPSEASLASVSVQGAGHLRRLGLLLERADPPTFAHGLAMDRILERLKERFQLVDSLLQSLDAPLVARIRGLGSRIRGPPSAA
jgi:hypothetical protein